MRLADLIILADAVQQTTTLHGLPIAIEVPAGGIRNGRRLYHSYGFISNTKGRDGDEVDCFVGPLKDANEVFVVHMLGPSPEEDEDKIFIGFPSADAAKASFLAHYPKSFYGGMTAMPVDIFKARLATSQLPYRRKKLTAEKGEKCPKCGSAKFGLMPTDFETRKCSKCGKTWQGAPPYGS